VDNTLSRGVADRDPGQVVLIKATLGAARTAIDHAVFRTNFQLTFNGFN
jgi:hypothetical protein